MLNRAADGAAEQHDQKYARQLASLCEKVAVRLRLQFGGRSIWQTRPRYGGKKIDDLLVEKVEQPK